MLGLKLIHVSKRGHRRLDCLPELQAEMLPTICYHPTGTTCGRRDWWQTLPGSPAIPVDHVTVISVVYMPTMSNPLHSNLILCGYSHHLGIDKIWPECFCHQLVEVPVSQQDGCRSHGMKLIPGFLPFWCRQLLDKYHSCYLHHVISIQHMILSWKFNICIHSLWFSVVMVLGKSLLVCLSVLQYYAKTYEQIFMKFSWLVGHDAFFSFQQP